MNKANFFPKNSFKRMGAMILLALCLIPSLVFAAEPINVAGVYECDMKSNGVRKQMYLTLDFVNGNTPDFTQVFTEKESSFRRLPKDFMNAKKLTRTFGGSKAPGFGKYKEKLLFANTEEFKLTNPRVENGVIKADWINAKGGKGECIIMVNEDRSLRILGLTKYTRDLSPDDIEMGLVEDRLPAGVQPFISPKEIVAYYLKEDEKTRVTPKVTPYWEGVDVQVVRAEQKGNTIEVKMRMRINAEAKYEKLYVYVAQTDLNQTFAETKDGKRLTNYKSDTPGEIGDQAVVPVYKDKWTDYSIYFTDVPGTVDYITTMKYDNYISAFFFDNHLTIIENLPVFQSRPK